MYLWIIGIFVLIVILLVVVAHYFYTLAFDRFGKNLFDANAETLQPESLMAPAREWFDPLFDQLEWTITTYDHLKLKASLIKHSSKPRGVVLITHGYLGKSKDMATFAKMFFDLGFDVLLPDARGHGRSEGSYYGFGWDERKDQVQWLEKLVATYGNDVEIVLYGISMGGATVMCTSGETLPNQVKLIIEDCGFTSVWDELAYQMKQIFHLPSFPILHATSLYTKVKLGFSFKQASALKQLKRNHLPILMIHGDADRFVPYEMLETLFESASEPKAKYIVKDVGHGGSYGKDPDKYKKVVSDFMNQYLKGDHHDL